MINKYFPKCPVRGPVDPVPYNHLGLESALPKKCVRCSAKFEGECLRGPLEGYMRVDCGPCSIQGETYPVPVSAHGKSWQVPKKCSECEFLDKEDDITKIKCMLNDVIWGCMGRSLDWGSWAPEREEDAKRGS